MCIRDRSPATVTVLCDNELEKSVRISGRIDTHPFTQTITLRKGERKIGFDLKIDWQHNVGIGAFRQKDGFNNNHRAFYDDRFNLNILFPVEMCIRDRHRPPGHRGLETRL